MLRKLAVVLFLIVGLMLWIIAVENKNEENNMVASGYVEEIENSNISQDS